MRKNLKTYAVFILIALLTGALSALLTRGSMNIYTEINKPPLAPPGYLFPIVWGVLYVLMGISSAMVYIKSKELPSGQKTGLGVYFLQLAVNFLWSIIFFSLRAFLFSFIWIILLWILIIIMIIRFYKVSPVAAVLQIPYLLWVTFAAYLNLAIYLIN